MANATEKLNAAADINQALAAWISSARQTDSDESIVARLKAAIAAAQSSHVGG